jgi:hemerythrin
MIVWREQMSVGNDLIDEDHRYLIGVVNEIQSACNARQPPTQILPFLERLAEYTNFHFDREMRMQIKLGYPEHEEHAEAHEALKQRLATITAQIVEETHRPVIDEAALERVLALNREWLIDHILKMDLKLRPYFSQRSPAWPG